MQLAVVSEEVASIPYELEEIYRRHSGMVFRTAYRLTGNAADAEDVLQTVFLRLMKRGEDRGPLEQEESYLRRAAINVSLDLIRGRAKDATLREDAADPFVTASPSELKDSLRHALATLAPRAAEMFTLRFLDGHTNPQIAGMLGVSQVLVAVTLHRARRRLQAALRSYLG